MFEESLSGDYFDVAYSTFTVPSATATTACSAASIWAGLGGWGAADLIQTGVQMIGNSTVVNTYPFIEYWSGNNVGGDCYSSECYLGYNVSAGDSMLAEVWAGDGSCRTADYSGGYGCFYLVDVTNGWTYLGVLSQINQFQGLTAEFIAEDNAPNNACDSNGTYTDFATVKAVFSAVDTTNTTHTWQSDPNGYVRMLSASASNQLLGFAAPLSPNKLNLTWMQGK
jgi:hypothetical protein